MRTRLAGLENRGLSVELRGKQLQHAIVKIRGPGLYDCSYNIHINLLFYKILFVSL